MPVTLELRQSPSLSQQCGILDNELCLIQQYCLNEDNVKDIESNELYVVCKVLDLKNDNDVF